MAVLCGIRSDTADKVFAGGIGYNKDGHSDVNNTSWALEALYYLKKRKPAKPFDGKGKEPVTLDTAFPAMKDLDWKAAREFISRCQNYTKTNQTAG